MAELNGLRALITRSLSQEASWRACLVQAGAKTVSVPLLQIEPLSAGSEIMAIKRLIMDLDHYQAAIFISQNAVKLGVEWIDRYWPQAPSINYLAVGSATAKALQREGYPVQSPREKMDSEALLALPVLQRDNITETKIIIFCGQGGRVYLQEALAKRRANVDRCELYRRILPKGARRQLQESDIGSANTLDMITIHSGEALSHLHKLLSPGCIIRQLPMLVPSARVASLAREYQFNPVIVADNATDGAMLAALIAWYKENS